MIKYRNGKDLMEAKEIRKWQEYRELYSSYRELYSLNDLDNHVDVVTHLEPDILECEIKWTLGWITTNKAKGCDGILAELF